MIGKEIDVLCIGNALVDVFARDDGHLISSRHGINLPVQHLEIERLRELLQELPEYTAVSGGGAANVAKIASLLGTRAGFIGSLGNDDFGQLFEKNLAEAGVNLRLKKSSSPTGLCLILDDGNGKIRIAASPSASLEFYPDDINEEELKKAALVLIDGFMLHRPGIVQYVLALAARNGITAAIDLSSPDIARDHADEILGYTGNELILFMNEEESLAFYNGLKGHGLSQKGSDDVLSFFQSINNGTSFPIIAVKLGARGAITIAGGEIHRTETKAIVPKESTGAGDAFCAAFLGAWLEKKPFSECAALGNKTAGIILGTTGTQIEKTSFPPAPTGH